MRAARISGFLWVLASLGACSCALDAAPVATSQSSAPAAPAPPVECATEKLDFTRENGCVNDGSVELCLASEDPAAEQAARAIASDLQCMPGSQGRVGCDPARETLCLVPLGDADCTERHGALTDAGWAKVCSLAALPSVRRIAPTWYE